MTTVTFNIDNAEVPLLKEILKKFGAKNIDVKEEKIRIEFLGDLSEEGVEELRTASEGIDNGDFVTHDEVKNNIAGLWK